METNKEILPKALGTQQMFERKKLLKTGMSLHNSADEKNLITELRNCSEIRIAKQKNRASCKCTVFLFN